MDEHGKNLDDTTEARAHLWDLIKDLKFAMFTTRHPNGHLHARPMTTQNQKIDEDDALWFLTRRSGDAAHDLAVEHGVNVSYADPGKDAYVSVSGNAEIVEDPEKVKQLWNKINQAWFPGGPTDPELALVKVTIIHASYWDVKESQIVQLWKMAKAAVTGDQPKMGEKADVHMH